MAAPKSRTFQHRCIEDTKQEHQCSHNDAYPTVSGEENETNREKEIQTVETKALQKRYTNHLKPSDSGMTVPFIAILISIPMNYCFY